MTVAFRPAELADRAFIIDGWISSYRTSHSAGFIQMADWHSVMWGQVERGLERPDVRTIVAYEPDVADHVADLYGFITADTQVTPPLVYYVFVKLAYRRAGYARGLFAAIGVDPSQRFHYACKTGACSRLASKIPLAKYNSLAGRYPKHEGDTHVGSGTIVETRRPRR